MQILHTPNYLKKDCLMSFIDRTSVELMSSLEPSPFSDLDPSLSIS